MCTSALCVKLKMSDDAKIEVSESGGDVTAAAAGADESKSGAPAGSSAPDGGFDAGTRKLVQKLPLLSVNAGPRDGAEWKKRLKQEYQALIRVRCSCGCAVRMLASHVHAAWLALTRHHRDGCDGVQDSTSK